MTRSAIALATSLALHALAGTFAIAEASSPAAPALDVTMTLVPTPPAPAPAPAHVSASAPVGRPARARPRHAPIVAADPLPATSSAVLDAAHTFAISSGAAALQGLFASGLGGAGDDDGSGNGAGAGPADACGDPATGVWTARFHWRSIETWSFVTLEVARDGAALTGEIRLHEWADDDLPDETARTDAARENHLRTHAAGHVVGDRMQFGWQGDRGVRTSSDRFSGRLGQDRYDAIWNDGIRAHDQRIRFRRVRC